jgi:hypothetical protein
MEWCEERGVSYILGLSRNPRLTRLCGKKMEKARRRSLITNKPARFYKSFAYRTKKSWSRSRRVVYQ